MKYLLDTHVVSALRVRGRNPAVEAWVTSIPVNELFVAATTIAEIERGVVVKERLDTGQGAILRRWFDDYVLPAFMVVATRNTKHFEPLGVDYLNPWDQPT